MKINLKWSFFFLWSCLFTLRFFMKSLLINNGEAFILRFLGLLALALLYGLFVRFTVPFKKEQIKIFRSKFSEEFLSCFQFLCTWNTIFFIYPTAL